MTSIWFDARGCLAPQGIAAFRAAPPGDAPPELARHVAGCARCQERLLSLEGLVPRKPGAVRDPARLWRNLALLGFVILLALIGMLVTTWRVAG
jgi:hypothetical protein